MNTSIRLRHNTLQGTWGVKTQPKNVLDVMYGEVPSFVLGGDGHEHALLRGLWPRHAPSRPHIFLPSMRQVSSWDNVPNVPNKFSPFLPSNLFFMIYRSKESRCRASRNTAKVLTPSLALFCSILSIPIMHLVFSPCIVQL